MGRFFFMSHELAKAVRTVVHECMGVRPNEEVLVVCNPATRELGDAFRTEAESIGAEAVLAVMTERASHAGEPPATVAEAMVAADVLLVPTIQSLSHTAARKRATESGTRTATLCGRNAVQISVPGGQRLDLEALAAGLHRSGIDDVAVNPYLLRARTDTFEITVFPDARAIIKGTEDERVARTVYAKYVGI